MDYLHLAIEEPSRGYTRPAGSALGIYNAVSVEYIAKRVGPCYKDTFYIHTDYVYIGSRTDGFGGKRDERIVRFIYAVMCELVEPGSPGKGAGIARDSCMVAYATDNRFGSRSWTISTKYQM